MAWDGSTQSDAKLQTSARFMGLNVVTVRMAVCVGLLSSAIQQGLGEEPAQTRQLVTAEASDEIASGDSVQQSKHTAWGSSELADAWESNLAISQPGLQLRPIAALGVNIAIPAQDDRGRTLIMPPDTALESTDTLEAVHAQPHPWPVLDYHWEATQLCHRPLYFEEINLERYGHSLGCTQPLFSAALFYGRVAAMPAKLVLEPPCQCVYTLGHFRPGSCAPFESYHPRPRRDRDVVTHGWWGGRWPARQLWDADVWDEYF